MGIVEKDPGSEIVIEKTQSRYLPTRIMQTTTLPFYSKRKIIYTNSVSAEHIFLERLLLKF